MDSLSSLNLNFIDSLSSLNSNFKDSLSSLNSLFELKKEFAKVSFKSENLVQESDKGLSEPKIPSLV